MLFASGASLVLRLRHSVGEERQQLKWVVYSVALLAFAVPSTILIIIVLQSLESVRVFFAVLFPLIPISVGIAILKYSLYDIDRIINRTLVYVTLTAILVALYFGGIVVLQRLLVGLTGGKSTLAVVASILLIAALFTPLRRRIQSFIDRRFYRRKYDARKTLEAFSNILRNETDLNALSEDLVGVVRETMQPAHVSLWLRPEAAPDGEHPR